MRAFSWFEDFTGVGSPGPNGDVLPAPGWQASYAPGKAGTISKPYGPGTGGIWLLGLYGGTSPSSPGEARAIRLRYGGAHPWDTVDARHFSPAKDLHFECRFFLNRADLLSVTVGMTGWNDPNQVLAALWGGPGVGWLLQARNIPDGGSQTSTNSANVVPSPIFEHAPGQWVDLEIRTCWAERRAILTINGQDIAEACGEMVTPQPMCAELQLWNRPNDQGVYSAPTMYVDAIGVTQQR